LDRYYRRRTRQSRDDDNEPIGTPLSPNWGPGLPAAPDGLWESATLALTQEEAEYLRFQIQCTHEDSLLCKLVAPGFGDFDADFPWHHPAVAGFPNDLQRDLVHARNLSETMHGAALVYNLMLARAQPHEERIESYEQRFDDWITNVETRRSELIAWYDRLNEFWSLAPIVERGVAMRTLNFVNRWLDLLFQSVRLSDLLTNPSALNLISRREHQLKGGRARLHNRRALELWQGASGDRQLDYRWAVVKQIISDITVALPETHA
jgi:hypothetical protein